MRKVMKSWPFRIGALVLAGIVLSGIVLSGIVLYWTASGTASFLFPRTGVLMVSGIVLSGIVLFGTAALLVPRTPVRIRLLVVSGIVLAGLVLDGTAYDLLPRTADGVSVTVLRCAPVQPVQPLQFSAYDCQGTTVFRRTFTDKATVSAVHATLDGLPEEVEYFADITCNAGSLCDPRQVYRFDLLWHGWVVRTYRTSVPTTYAWAVRTLGLELWATGGSTTWQDMVRLTGVPVPPFGVPSAAGRTACSSSTWPMSFDAGAGLGVVATSPHGGARRQRSNANRYKKG